MKQVSGFSRLSKDEKVSWLSTHMDQNISNLKDFWIDDPVQQKVFDELSENTISNFIMPYGIAPNFLINDKEYAVPMVIEESSVVAAASKSAKQWSKLGGFKVVVHGTTKIGHIHLTYSGSSDDLEDFFLKTKDEIQESLQPFTANMEARGGGVKSLKLINKTNNLDDYYQIEMKFDTCDAMGANFINTVLESYGRNFLELAKVSTILEFEKLEINMCILSNYTSECLVSARLECPLLDLDKVQSSMPALEFARKFKRAIDISKVDISRAVTHNKGIFNGIDAVVLATGNDFRAIEAAGHAYASRYGSYAGLSNCSVNNDTFVFELTLPIAVGTVGGLTSLHPLAKSSLDILGKPSAKELMGIVVSVGLAQNFGAVSSLVTTGIQKGHMKMHLLNILNQLKATNEQVVAAKEYFKDRVVSFTEVRNFLNIH